MRSIAATDHLNGAPSPGGGVIDTSHLSPDPNATPRTLGDFGGPGRGGCAVADISRRLYRSKPERQLKLFGRVLDRLVASEDSRIVWSTLEDADLAATGCIPSDAEGIIDLLAQAETAEVAILFKQAPPGHD